MVHLTNVHLRCLVSTVSASFLVIKSFWNGQMTSYWLNFLDFLIWLFHSFLLILRLHIYKTNLHLSTKIHTFIIANKLNKGSKKLHVLYKAPLLHITKKRLEVHRLIWLNTLPKGRHYKSKESTLSRTSLSSVCPGLKSTTLHPVVEL